VTGSVAFDRSGEPTTELTLLEIRGDDFVEIDPGQRPSIATSENLPPIPAP
jgi:hypothetical protein